MMFLTKIYKLYRYQFYSRFNHIRGANRLNDFLKELAQIGVKKYEGSPDGIFESKWDNLLILDACRHDLYEEVNGETESRISVGSDTRQFIEETFSNGDYSNVVYVTANPHFSEENFRELTGRDVEEVFHSVYHVYDTDWNNENKTVMPQPVIRDFKSARKLFPDKKIIAHFMQPHHPFINHDLGDNTVRGNVWGLAERGKISRRKIWEAYKDNLELVMGHVEKLISGLEGRTVITSDHGNLVGENNLYHHPYNSDAEVMRKVPWDVKD